MILVYRLNFLNSILNQWIVNLNYQNIVELVLLILVLDSYEFVDSLFKLLDIEVLVFLIVLIDHGIINTQV